MKFHQWISLLLVLLLLWGVFVWQYESYRYQRMQRLTRQYSVFLEPYLWNFDEENIQEILKFITELRSFRSAKVLHEDGSIFARSRNVESVSYLEMVLKQLGLVRTVQFTYPLVYKNNAIGSFKVRWTNRSFYMHANVALLLTLLGTAVYFYLRNRVRKRELQQLRLEKERKAREEAEASARAKSDFLAKMSHELRTPLTAIIGYSEMLYENFDNLETNQVKSDLQKIERAGNHLQDLINNILDLSKIEAGKIELNPEEFELSELCHDVLGTLEQLANKNGNELTSDLPDESVTMYADRTKVRQCLFNLISNACKYTQDGSILLNLDRESRDNIDGVRIAVEDTGKGIEEERLELLFEAFEQEDRDASDTADGTGLGLTITQKFCDIMGGELTAESEPGLGSTFTIWLPKSNRDGG